MWLTVACKSATTTTTMMMMMMMTTTTKTTYKIHCYFHCKTGTRTYHNATLYYIACVFNLSNKKEHGFFQQDGKVGQVKNGNG